MREDRQSLRLNSQDITRYTHTHIFWWAVLHCSYPLPDQQCSLGLFRSLSPLQESNSPPVWPTIPMPPLSSYFLSSLSLSFSLSLINVKPSNNKAGILSLPGSSVPCICHCALTLPLHQLSGHHHPFTWPQSRNSGPHCQHERLFRGSVRKEVRRRHFSHFCLFFLPFPAFLWSGEERDSIVYIIHGHETGENGPLSSKKKFGWSSHGGWSDMYASLCAPDPSSPFLSIHHHSPHTQSLSHVRH